MIYPDKCINHELATKCSNAVMANEEVSRSKSSLNVWQVWNVCHIFINLNATGCLIEEKINSSRSRVHGASTSFHLCPKWNPLWSGDFNHPVLLFSPQTRVSPCAQHGQIFLCWPTIKTWSSWISPEKISMAHGAHHDGQHGRWCRSGDRRILWTRRDPLFVYAGWSFGFEVWVL